MGAEETWATVARGLRTVWWASLLSIPANLLALVASLQAGTGAQNQSREMLWFAYALSALPWMMYLLGQWWCLAGSDTRGATPLGWSLGVAFVGTFAFGAAAAGGLVALAYAGLGLAAFVSSVLWLVYLFRLTHDLCAHKAHDRLTAYRKRLMLCIVFALALSGCELSAIRRTGESSVGLIVAAASMYSIYISWYYFVGLRAAALAVERQGRAPRESRSGSSP